jgi:hypothetical protein
MSQSTEILRDVRREVVHTTQEFDRTVEKLYSSIGKPGDASWESIAKEIKSYEAQAREDFSAKVNAKVGQHGFMIFQVCL